MLLDKIKPKVGLTGENRLTFVTVPGDFVPQGQGGSTSTTKGLRIPNLASNPSSPNTGDLYYNTASGQLKVYDGSSWDDASAEGGGGGSSNLDTAYSIGQTITVDEGAIALTDASTGALHTMSFTQTGVKSGNILDFSVDAAMTGDAIALDMNTGVAARGIFIDNGATARTGADILVTCDSTGAHSVIDINASGAGASIGFDWTGSYNGSPAGKAISLTFDNTDALDTDGLLITRGTGVRTAPAINIDDSSTGSADIIDIDVSGVYTGDVIDITTSAAATGNALFVNLDSAVAMTAIHIEGSGVRTQPYIELITDSTSSASLIDLSVDGAITGAAVIDIDMNLGLAAAALFIDAGNGVRTADIVDCTFDGSGNVSFLDLNASNTGSGNLIDIAVSGVHTGHTIAIAYSAAATGDAIWIDMNANLAGSALVLDYGNGTRTDDMCKVTFDGDGTSPFWDIDITNSGAGGTSDYWDIDVTGVFTGSILDIAYSSAASTGDAVAIDLGTAVAAKAFILTGTGARTDDIFEINDDSTGNSHIFDINMSGIYTGNILDITFATAAATGNAIDLNMGTNLAGNAININLAGIRTAPAIVIDGTNTDGGTDDHVIDINQTGLLDSNVLDITFGTAASTGNAISLAMGTNVAGMAIDVSSAATGTSGEGSCYNVAHTGDLAAGADVARIYSSGSPSATSNLLAIEQETGAGSAGAYGLYINCTGANVEALKVDAGKVVLDETLEVTGLATLTAGIDAKVIFAGTETIAAGGTSTALSLSKTLHHIDADAGGDTFTLADGTTGQIMILTMESSTGVATITPTNFASGTSVTFNAAGDSVTLLFQDAKWYVMGGNSYTIV